MKRIITADKIYLSFDPVKECEAVLISEGMVEKVGELAAIESQAGKEVEIVQYQGCVVMPGFVDSHMHMDELGRYLAIVDLRGVKSIGELKHRLSGTAAKGEWVLGHGWDQDLFLEKRWPTRSDLDEVIPDKPVLLTRVDLHSAVLNSRALETLGIQEKFGTSPDVVRDSNGLLTGVVKEAPFGYADDYVKSHLPEEMLTQMLLNAVSECARLGVTTVGFVSCSMQQLELLRKIRGSKKLTVRARVYFGAEGLNDFTGFPDDSFLRVNGLKLFSDGSFGSRTALMSFQYFDDPGNYGNEINSREKLLEYIRTAESKGLHVATHAIGDAALDNVIWAYSRSKKGHRIEHAALVRGDQYDRIKSIGATLVVQPHFIITDFWTLERIGHENASTAYPFNSLKRSGIPLAFSTDCPVEMLNPWETVYAAVTRGIAEEIPLGIKTPDECIDVRNSLDYYTRGSAAALNDATIGSLEPGKWADFIVIDTDPLSAANEKIKEIHVKETWVNGEKVYSHS